MTELNLQFRKATSRDVEHIVRLMNASGPDGKPRSVLPAVIPAAYYAAFEKINRAPDNDLMVVALDSKIIGTFHVTYITYLAGLGQQDAQVEAVHVHEQFRGQRIGSRMMEWVIEQARERGCRRVQLTSHKMRKDAHRFYQRLGFQASHEGMKLVIE